ncbi:hypothetical protein HRI_003101500 [Hibiscus trionum]|uniref:Uncharacterized protein n=1 Tax=Hibiscus trionum TaxID=183268 RepID=A0A9W7M8M3_HIBTR|nr:hypothetical protein HRI_003101500 [Hibiscus trionum]
MVFMLNRQRISVSLQPSTTIHNLERSAPISGHRHTHPTTVHGSPFSTKSAPREMSNLVDNSISATSPAFTSPISPQ